MGVSSIRLHPPASLGSVEGIDPSERGSCGVPGLSQVWPSVTRYAKIHRNEHTSGTFIVLSSSS
jgi:hypothetical protein